MSIVHSIVSEALCEISSFHYHKSGSSYILQTEKHKILDVWDSCMMVSYESILCVTSHLMKCPCHVMCDIDVDNCITSN